jgi:alpha/beta superfamily hydrolase
MLKALNKCVIAGPVGALETIVVLPQGEPQGVAVICHPNPLQGGTNTNKVVQTAAKALSQLGYACYCPNLRGVGRVAVSMIMALARWRMSLPWSSMPARAWRSCRWHWQGFSFGGFVAARTRAVIEADKLLLMGVAVGKYTIPTQRCRRIPW